MTTKWLVLAGLSGAALLAAGYYSAPESGSGPGAVDETAMEPGWVRHRDPTGFVIEHADDWSVQTDPATGRVLVSGPAGEEIRIWPVFVPDGLDVGAATALLRRMTARVRPHARWDAAQPAGATAICFTGRDGPRRAIAALTWVPAPSGAAAFMYEVVATPERLHVAGDTVARILGSFRLVGRQLDAGERSRSSQEAPRYLTFRDPSEGAWSLEVPEGWTPQGGLLRLAPVDVRHGFAAVSASGGARIFSGDVRIPAYSLPTDAARFRGAVEGSAYSPGYGVQMEMRSFMTGQIFAEFYVRSYLAPDCGQVSITESRDRPDLAEIGRQAGVARMVTAGQVAFSCQAPNGARFEGMCGARTNLLVGIWRVVDLYGYLAVAHEVASAREALAHAMSTFRADPNWVRMQLGVTAHASAATAEATRFTSKVAAEVRGRREDSLDELARRRSNATLGVEDVTDPVTGRQFRVESGGDHYWVNAAGNIVGTDIATAPSIDFRQLLRRP